MTVTRKITVRNKAMNPDKANNLWEIEKKISEWKVHLRHLDEVKDETINEELQKKTYSNITRRGCKVHDRAL